MVKRPPKSIDIEDVRKRGREKRFVLLDHTLRRCHHRYIEFAEIQQVLSAAERYPEKDSFEQAKGNYKFGIQGVTVDGKYLWMTVIIDPTDMLVVTVVDPAVSKEDERRCGSGEELLPKAGVDFQVSYAKKRSRIKKDE